MNRLNLINIDNIFNSKFRLAIIALLSGGDEIEFSYFRNELDISDGNLSSHMDKLEKAGFIIIKKSFKGKKPKTSYRISDLGLKHYKLYLDEISKLI